MERGTYGKGWKEGYKKTQTLGHEGYIYYLDCGDGFWNVITRPQHKQGRKRNEILDILVKLTMTSAW